MQGVFVRDAEKKKSDKKAPAREALQSAAFVDDDVGPKDRDGELHHYNGLKLQAGVSFPHGEAEWPVSKNNLFPELKAVLKEITQGHAPRTIQACFWIIGVIENSRDEEQKQNTPAHGPARFG